MVGKDDSSEDSSISLDTFAPPRDVAGRCARKLLWEWWCALGRRGKLFLLRGGVLFKDGLAPKMVWGDSGIPRITKGSGRRETF